MQKRKNIGAAFGLSCALLAGGILHNDSRAWAQEPSPAPPQPAPKAEPRDKGEEEADESILGEKLGAVCTVRHQSGSTVTRDTGILRQVDDDWLVLDELRFVRTETVTAADGRKVARSVWQRSGKQIYISTEYALTLEFGADATVL
jgi:hypothetical protein